MPKPGGAKRSHPPAAQSGGEPAAKKQGTRVVEDELFVKEHTAPVPATPEPFTSEAPLEMNGRGAHVG
jgi:hypothetical protein